MNIYSNTRIKQEYSEYLLQSIRQSEHNPVLAVYLIGDNPASLKYVSMKQKMASSYGIDVLVRAFPVDASLDQVSAQIQKDNTSPDVSGIIVQLPIPQGLTPLLALIETRKDVDVLNPNSPVILIQPTVQAALITLNDILTPHAPIEEKLNSTKSMIGKIFVTVGQGTLVGKPITEFMKKNNIEVLEIDKHTKNPHMICQKGDIIVSGAGVPGLITPKWIKKGSIIIDAATSNADGQLKGDVDMTQEFDDSITVVPSPGGIGPLTVLSLFLNVMKSV